MAARYRVEFYSTSGSLIYQTDDYNSLEYNLLLNDKSNHVVTLRMDTLERLGIEDDVFQPDNFVVVKRSDPAYGLDWYTDYEGFHRSIQHSTSERNLQLCTSYGRSYEDLLARRTIAYKAGAGSKANKASLAAETAAKQYVDENAGVAATVALGREAEGTIPGLVIAPDQARGALWSGSDPWQNLFDEVKKIAIATGCFFYIRRSGTTFTFEFSDVYGTSRIAGSAEPVIFAEAFGNMVTPSYNLSRLEEVNRVIILGQGEEALRTVNVSNSLAAQTNSPWNLIEKSHDARNSSSAAALEAEGDEQLALLQAKENFTFQVLQSDTTRYGLHYFHGDVVTAKMHGIERNKRIVGVSAKYADGKESLSFQFAETAVNPDPMVAILENINKRIRAIELRENL